VPLKIVPDLIESNFVVTYFPNGEAALAPAELGEDSSGNLIAREPASRGNCTARYNSPSLLYSYLASERANPIDRENGIPSIDFVCYFYRQDFSQSAETNLINRT